MVGSYCYGILADFLKKHDIVFTPKFCNYNSGASLYYTGAVITFPNNIQVSVLTTDTLSVGSAFAETAILNDAVLEPQRFYTPDELFHYLLALRVRLLMFDFLLSSFAEYSHPACSCRTAMNMSKMSKMSKICKIIRCSLPPLSWCTHRTLLQTGPSDSLGGGGHHTAQQLRSYWGMWTSHRQSHHPCRAP